MTSSYRTEASYRFTGSWNYNSRAEHPLHIYRYNLYVKDAPHGNYFPTSSEYIYMLDGLHLACLIFCVAISSPTSKVLYIANQNIGIVR